MSAPGRAWWSQLTPYAWSEARALATLALLMLVGVALETLRPWPLKIIVDSVLGGKPLSRSVAWLGDLPSANSAMGMLTWLSAATVILLLVGWGVKLLQAYLQAGAGLRMTYALSADMFEKLQRLSLRFHGRSPSGDLVKRVTTDTGCVKGLVLDTFFPLLSSSVTLVALFVVMLRLDWTLALLSIGVAPLLALTILRLAGPMEQRSHEFLERQGEVMALADRTLSALPAVRAFAREAHEDRRFDTVLRNSDRSYLRTITTQLQFRVVVSSVTALGTAGLLLLGGLHVLDGKLTVGSLLVFVAYLAALYAPLETLAYLTYSYASAAAGARRVIDVLEQEEPIRDAANARTLVLVPGAAGVSFHNVTVGYDTSRPVLKGLSLEVRPGETIAIVGPTGAGKTTLVSLILRFLDPWQGSVLLGGEDAREVNLKSLRSQVALVLQEPFLLPLSVAANIAYGAPHAKLEDIHRAALAANADSFIRALPQGYDTVLGERGATLSGGERQRLAIARALLKDAPVLILDEPTSSLDSATEAQILDALDHLRKGRTTLIIAHRMATIQRADRVVVLSNGSIVQLGTHAELMASGGMYADFCRTQFGVATAESSSVK